VKVTILGCGTSHGVPRIGNVWGKCDPQNPKNRRRRVSILVEDEVGTKLLVDTSPDLREQLLDANVDHLDAVFYTHDHADHTHGIDDLRGVYHCMGSEIPVYGDQRTLSVLQRRFDYIFEGRGGYPAIATVQAIRAGESFQFGSIKVTPFLQEHGRITSFGYRFNSIAYSTDLNEIPKESEPYLEGLDLWILDALRYDPHPTHPHLERSLSWIEKFAPKRAILTHMNWDMDYETLCCSLPKGVEPGYDGLSVILNKR
jgi:phosphoribosyl 1,2-cyclic phosphate phosphodiesterase